MGMAARVLGGCAGFVLACAAGLGATVPDGSPHELLQQAKARVLDAKRAGPFTLTYALRFPDGTMGTYVWRERDRNSGRQDIRVGGVTAASGTLAGHGWRTPGDVLPDASWLASSLFAFDAQLTPEEGHALEARTQRVDGNDFVEVLSHRRQGRGNWAVFLSVPSLDLSLSDIGFLRRSYADWKPLRGAGMVPGVCRIYVQGALALEMTLAQGTNRPIADADLAPPANAVERPSCPAEISPPRLVKRTSPVYPDEARRARAEGLVVLSATIAAGGLVTGVRLVHPPAAKAEYQALLVNAAIAAVEKWRYEPARCQGAPIATDLTVTISFTLE